MKQKISIIILILLSTLLITPCSGQDKQGKITPLPGLLDEAGMLVQETNIARQTALKSILEEKNIPYEIESFQNTSSRKYPRTEGKNIVITVGSGEKDIVIGAHYDAVWLRNDSLSHGLIDNGCAAIILIRLAEKLKDADLNHRIKIVLFDMEEIGLVGSRAYVEQHKNDPIEYMINLDVCGYGNTLMIGPRNMHKNNIIYKTLKEVCVIEDINFVEFPSYPSCDDGPFHRAGITSISLGSASETDTHYFWLFLNDRKSREAFKKGFRPELFTKIHTKNDNISNVDPMGMTICYRAVLETVKKLDKRMKN